MKNIDICFGVDSNYVPYMGSTIMSLLINEEKHYHITFHVITSDITEDDKNKILSLKEIRDFDIKYYFIDAQKYEKWFKKINVKHHFEPSIFFRLSIPDVLKDIDKVLYTDCDVIYTKGIGHLFDEDINDYYAFVLENCTTNSENNNRNEYKKSIGLSIDDDFISSGFMFINNRLWIDNNIEKDFIEYANNRKTFYFPDMDILNYTLAKKKLKRISHLYNFFSHKNYHPSNELHNIEDLIGIHYLTGYKPWKGYCPNVFFVDEFWKYFMMTPWFRENIYKYTKIIATQEFYLTKNKLNNMIDKLAWWIPVKKWRDSFKDKVKSFFIMIIFFK